MPLNSSPGRTSVKVITVVSAAITHGIVKIMIADFLDIMFTYRNGWQIFIYRSPKQTIKFNPELNVGKYRSSKIDEYIIGVGSNGRTYIIIATQKLIAYSKSDTTRLR